MRILYGIPTQWRDVTSIAKKHLLKNGTIQIPADEGDRARVFGDPVPNVVKQIRIITDGVVMDYPAGEIIQLQDVTETFDFGEWRRQNWVKEGQKLRQNPNECLAWIHNQVALVHGNMSDEFPEQSLTVCYLDPDVQCWNWAPMWAEIPRLSLPF